LYSGFVSKTERPEDFTFKKEGQRFGGQWFCPGCGVLMNEATPGAVTLPPYQSRQTLSDPVKALDDFLQSRLEYEARPVTPRKKSTMSGKGKTAKKK
jgi:hypothetical protein